MDPLPNTERPIWKRLTPFRAVRLVIGVATALALVAATLERLIDPGYPTFGRAAWWAIQTVSTVGYGDALPESAAGRWIAAGLMLMGMGLIPVLTSLVVSVLIANRAGDVEASAAADRAEFRRIGMQLEERLARIEQSLEHRPQA